MGHRRSMRRLGALLLIVVVATAACSDDDAADEATPDEASPASGGPPEWPAPPDPEERTSAAGLELEVTEQLAVHRHSHLDVFFNGDSVTVPAGVGIVTDDPSVQSFDDPGGTGYGLSEDCDNPCISPLHTHAVSGILHTESAGDELHTLGQFFVEWGVELDEECVGDYCSPDTDIAVYVNGDLVSGNPADIELADQTQIAIVIGTPPEDIPDTADFTQT
jgi:hypothetical protein